MFSNIAYKRDLVLTLLAKELKLRYKSSFLGYIWSLLNPLSMAVIFYYVFDIILKVDVSEYALFLVAGVFPWTWVGNSIGASSNAFLNNGSLIKKVIFPRWLLVMVVVLNEGVHFLISIPVILAVMLYFKHTPTWIWLNWLWQIPLLWLITGVMISGIALVVATANIFFRDLERIVGIFLMIMVYVTPVMFPASWIPARYLWTFNYNPFAWIIISWRSLFYNVHPTISASMDWEYVTRAAIGALICFAVGYGVYLRKVWRFAEIV